jgi:hypothetical protein
MQPITLHAFDGGIHPEENKQQSTQTAVYFLRGECHHQKRAE